ncbi:MAG: type VII secretion protein EssC [Lachnospiraceae bacterium]|nr:type VII secretion protein EssC [Lachnospiraceae bacterium]
MRCYERKEKIWIADQNEICHADIRIHDLSIQLLIDRNDVVIKRELSDEVCLNDTLVTENRLQISEGDTLTFDQISITFFDTYIEMEGDEERIQTTLLPCKNRNNYFEGFPFYKRSPRVIYKIQKEKIEIQSPPQKKELTKGGLAQMIIPPVCMLAFTIAMGVLLKRGSYIFMSIGMTIITTIFSVQKFISDTKDIKKENKDREIMYENYLLDTRKRILKARKAERTALEYQNPTLSELEHMVSSYSSRIYERSILDDDFLNVNLGYYRGKSSVEVTTQLKDLEIKKDELAEEAKAIPKDFRKIDHIPVQIDLKRAHLGLVGSKANVHEQIKYLLAQITFFQSYRDLQIILIHNRGYDEEFEYANWYPHLRIQAINVYGRISSEQARDQILGSIQQILKDRKMKQEEEKQETVFSPYYLFIIDEPKLILNHAIMEYLQSKQMTLGFSIIYTTDQKANLPENIRTVCILHDSQSGTLLIEEGEKKDRKFQVQHINEVDLEGMARSLSALIHEQGVSSKIPESITFFDMYGITHPEELQIKERWKKNESHKSLAVPLGVRAENDYVELNLHEKAHGPHGLVAGTTGSGKSEIVQSYILSLAVNFHPHEVGFLLIDYKGGGMANLFAKLPHLLGTITNLDKAESMRAMASIKSELSRRQRIFSDNNVNHINGYNKLFKLGKVAEPLPHLFLISDEFAELKKEQPEFMSELVSTARIGRSLGIHLILATQKPSGVVDDQIWTNSKFRLCLKVQNAGDSKEMLKTPDAANITQAGRAYLQVGNNEIYELFQSAWSGATYSSEQTEEEKEDDRVYLISPLGQGRLINQDLSGSVESNQIKATQLDAIVEHLHDIYETEKAVEVKKPWLPSLPELMQSPYTKQVQDSAAFQQGDYTLGIGMIDVPEEQLQEEYVLNLIKNGHLLYMASSGYGKTMFLTNIALGLSMKNAVKNLNFYILDLGNSGLIPLKGLPHVADYMGLDDGEKIEKFQKLILDEMAERKRKFAKAMAQSISVYNSSQPEPLKILVILIDNFDSFKELGDKADQFIQKVSRDGAGLGIYLLITMGRINSMKGAVLNNIKERIAGYNFEAGENRSLIGRSDYNLPEDKKGRVLVKRDNVNVMQIYTPVPCESELAYNANLKALVSDISHASTEEHAKGIPMLPEELYSEMLPQYPGYEESSHKIPVGIEVNDLNVQYLDISKGVGMIIGGAGTGRTNLLHQTLHYLQGRKVWILDQEKRTSAEFMNVERFDYGADFDSIHRILGDIDRECQCRKEDYEEAKLDNLTLTLYDFLQTKEPVYVVIDIVQELYALLQREGAAEEMDILEEAVKWGIYVIVSSEPKIPLRSGKFMELVGQSKTGIILGNIKEQKVFEFTGLREENRRVEYGYRHTNGVNQKIMLAKYMEV